ncbi:hypothetical protein H2241_17870 [Pantoea ananatis]|uniref:hypothetical protein n=1 Tax=Pantoea ananas TaxID=553 RepID=UPI00158DE9F0|nr:hypothetical protein [Pantoea ananatis]MBA4822817.1 hypothetical protein [Pantoea ananatis]QKV87608.1 hypothetical protein FOB88_10935 [Pantoea ananatis]
MEILGFAPQKVLWFRNWVLRKSFMDVVDLHFTLTGAVQNHYRLRTDNKHLMIAISACEYMVTISDIVMDAMIAKTYYQIYEYEQIVGKYPYPKTFIAPRNVGYDQLGVILRRYKHKERDEFLKSKMLSEGWRGGAINLSEIKNRHFLHQKG